MTVESVDAVGAWADAEPGPPGLHEVFAALSNPDRLAILAELRPTPEDLRPARTVSSLAFAIGLSRFSASRHLRQLCDAGLVEVTRQRTALLHRLAITGLARVEDWLYPIVDSLDGAEADDGLP